MQGVPIGIDDMIGRRQVLLHLRRYDRGGKMKAWFGLGIATGISAVIGLLLILHTRHAI